jgi:hypothetical protein
MTGADKENFQVSALKGVINRINSSLGDQALVPALNGNDRAFPGM